MHVFRTGDLSGSFPTKGEEVIEDVAQATVLQASDGRSEKIREAMEEMKVRFFLHFENGCFADRLDRHGNGPLVKHQNLTSPSPPASRSGTS